MLSFNRLFIKYFVSFKKSIFIAILTVAFIIGGVTLSLSILKDDAIDSHIKIANLYSKHLSDIFAQSISNLSFISENIEIILKSDDNLEVLQKEFKNILSYSPYIRSINLLNKSNSVIFSSSSENLNAYIDIKEFFPKPLFDKTIMRFSTPLSGRDIWSAKELSSIDSKSLFFIPILKPISIQNLDYKLIFSLNSDFFVNIFNQNIDKFITEIDVISIDNILMFSTDSALKIGSEIESNKILQEAQTNNFQSGLIEFNNIKTIVSYRSLNRYPFIVVARLNYKKALRSWEEKRYSFLLVMNVLIFLTVGLFFILIVRYVKSKERESYLQNIQLENHKKFKILFEESHLFTIIFSKTGEIIDTNQNMLKHFALNKKSIIGRNISELGIFSEDDRAWLFDLIHNFSIENSSKELNLISKLEDRVKNIEFTVVAINLVDRSEFVAIGFDVTDKNEANSKLETAKELAENANRAKSDFLANMSHEIRTPLNGVIGLIELLFETQITDIQKDYLEKSMLSAKFLLGLISDILDYSKIEAGKMHLDNQEFDLSSLLSNLENLLIEQSRSKDIRLNFHYNIKHSRIIGDSLRVMQIFTNLISNAIKFTKVGGVDVFVNLIEESSNEIEFQFVIEDSGIGMSESTQTNIFKKFSQADSSITRNYGGTGLGLAISKELVEKMGGSIWVESCEGVGSKFYFQIRFKKAENQTESSQEESKSLNLNIQNSTILVVEDNRINQIVVNGMLKNLNLNFKNANNGLEAIEICKLEKFDLILMDLQMPIVDGYKATESIKADSLNKTTPIVALSANIMQNEIERAFSVGMFKYLTKPIEKLKFISVLNEALHINIQTKNAQTEDFKIDIDGLNLNNLIKRVGNNEKLIKKLLYDFANSYKNFESKFIDINSEEFSKNIHSLKGVSGNLALEKIFDISSQIYKSDDLTLKEELKSKLFVTLQKTIDTILVDFAYPSNGIESKKYDSSEMESFIEEILIDLDSFKAIAPDRIEKLFDMLSSSSDIKILKEALESFDYKRAIEILKNIKALEV